MSAIGQTPSLELRAQMISDAGPGLSPTSKVREAIKAEALKQLRELVGVSEPSFYGHSSDIRD